MKLHPKEPVARGVRWLIKTIPGRALLASGALLSAIFALVGVVVFSVWMEDRFPSGDKERALFPAAQEALTRPIVNAISRQAERHVRKRSEALYMATGLTVEETISQFLDDHVDLARRRIHAYRLARIGSPECIAALLKVFQTAPPEHKAFMAQLIGSTGNPAAKEWLWPLLDDGNERVAKAGVRALSAIGGEDVTARIAEILGDDQRQDWIRIEAAVGLGTMGTPESRDALTGAFGQAIPKDLSIQILNSLGQFEFPAVSETFQQLLAAPQIPRVTRVAAAEALAESSAEAVPFLIELAETDRDADVRASAAWALSSHEPAHDLGPTLAELAEHEPAADVRRRLYEAMLPQADLPAERLLPVVQSEQDLAARVAGLNALGLYASRQPDSPVASAFDRELVPELLKIATTANSLNIQMRAVFALRRAQSVAAQTALRTIANSGHPQIAIAARNGLRSPNG